MYLPILLYEYCNILFENVYIMWVLWLSKGHTLNLHLNVNVTSSRLSHGSNLSVPSWKKENNIYDLSNISSISLPEKNVQMEKKKFRQEGLLSSNQHVTFYLLLYLHASWVITRCDPHSVPIRFSLSLSIYLFGHSKCLSVCVVGHNQM